MVQAASQGKPSKDRPHQQPNNLTWCIKLFGKCHPNQIKMIGAGIKTVSATQSC